MANKFDINELFKIPQPEPMQTKFNWDEALNQVKEQPQAIPVNPHTRKAIAMQDKSKVIPIPPPVKPVEQPQPIEPQALPQEYEKPKQLDTWGAILAGAIPLLASGLFGGSEGLQHGAKGGAQAIEGVQRATQEENKLIDQRNKELMAAKQEQAKSELEKNKWQQEFQLKQQEFQIKKQDLNMKLDKHLKESNTIPEAISKLEGDLRKEFKSDPRVKDYYELATAANTVLKYDKMPSKDLKGIRQVDILFGFMKVLDPGSRVTGSEVALSKEATPTAKKWALMLNKFNSGDIADKDTVTEMIEITKRNMNAAAEGFNTVREEMAQLASGYPGVRLEQVTTPSKQLLEIENQPLTRQEKIKQEIERRKKKLGK